MSEQSHTDVQDAAPTKGLHQLMERYIDGDQRAFTALYAQLSERVRARLGRMIRNDATVEDLVQQTFMRAHQARCRYTPGTSNAHRAVEGWYLAIARNVALDYLRHQYRQDHRHAKLAARGEIEGMGASAERPDPEQVHVDEEVADERARNVRAAINQLPPGQREVVLLHKLRGMSMREIAERLEVRPGALRVRAHRAYKALASILTLEPKALPSAAA